MSVSKGAVESAAQTYLDREEYNRWRLISERDAALKEYDRGLADGRKVSEYNRWRLIMERLKEYEERDAALSHAHALQQELTKALKGHLPPPPPMAMAPKESIEHQEEHEDAANAAGRIAPSVPPRGRGRDNG